MSTTMTGTNIRVTVENGWAVRDLPNGDQVRARLTIDRHTEEPWREHTGVSLVREADGYNGVTLDEHDGLTRVLDRINHEGRHWYVTREADDQERLFEAGMSIRDYWTRCEHVFKGGEVEAREFVRRYLRAFWDVEDAFLFSHQGYSQSDWADIWVIVHDYGVEGAGATTEEALGVVQEWSDWAKGDVFVVKSQTRTLADAIAADPDDPDDGWGGDEHVGGYIGHECARTGIAGMLGVSLDLVPAAWLVTSYE